jgi:membrane protein YdbS with pleckstrin-like domain
MTAEFSQNISDLRPVAPGYKNVLRLRLALFWAPLAIAAIVVDQLALSEHALHGLPSVALPLLAALIIGTVPQRAYARLHYGLTDKLLQVVRGWLFHTDTVVPFVRVQHLDVLRGPFDKMFGTATLVVHTAGNHNSIVSLPGLAPETAAEIRDIIKEHVRTDFG